MSHGNSPEPIPDEPNPIDQTNLRDRVMSTPTTDDLPHAAEVIELEPTMTMELFQSGAGSASGSYRPRPAVGIGEGSLASLAGETETLRRRRLFAAAVSLTATFGVLCVWVFASDNPGTLTVEGSRYSLRVGLIGLRCLLAVSVAGLLASEVPLSRKQLRTIEYVLFLGVTLILMVSQYFVGLDLMHRGPAYLPILLAFIKDGVIQMLALMMIYGTLIPNPPAVAARVLLAMFLGPVATVFLLRLIPEAAPIVGRLSAAEEAGSNFLFLGMGTALAVYGSFLLNGLRTQLHEARKFGQYQLLQKLGEGGMGEIYLAEHGLLKRPCALKLIKSEAGADPISAGAVRARGAVGSAARTPQYDRDLRLRPDRRRHVLLRDGVPPRAESLRSGAPVRTPSSGRVIYLFRQVCAGLAEAHELGLVHRDLKPANLFVAVRGGESDVAKVLDFGLVKLTSARLPPELTGEMMVSGTPLYMAPEQAIGDRTLDARADIYALGAMMYFALTAQPPFTGLTAMAVMMRTAAIRSCPRPRYVPTCRPISSESSFAAWPRSPRIVTRAQSARRGSGWLRLGRRMGREPRGGLVEFCRDRRPVFSAPARGSRVVI